MPANEFKFGIIGVAVRVPNTGHGEITNRNLATIGKFPYRAMAGVQ